MYKENMGLSRLYCKINAVSHSGPMVEAHWHDFHELLFVEKGIAEETADAWNLRIREGDLFLIRAGTVHSTTALTEECSIRVILFHECILGEINLTSFFYYSSNHEKSQEYGKLVHKIFEEEKAQSVGYQLAITGCLYQLIAELIRQNGLGTKDENLHNMQKVVRYIEEHIADNLTLREVANFFGYTPQYFTTLLKKYTGMYYKDYYDTLRIRMASRYLLFEEESIAEIAEKLGYRDASSFIRAFKRKSGYTPAQYRQEMKYLK